MSRTAADASDVDHVQPISVQSYIDETPLWPDGTGTSGVPMTRMQWRIWMLATAGKFFEGLVVFMTGVALPLMVVEFGLSAAEKGVVGAATRAGILIGATALGGLADTLRAQADVHRRDDHLRHLPGRAESESELYLAGGLLVRRWARARL